MADASYNVFSPNRDFRMKNIFNACSEKKWSIARDLAKDYADYCEKYWEKYSVEFKNSPINKCGSCSEQKRFLVNYEWPDVKRYQFSGQLVCMNYVCEFYLIINVNQYNSSCKKIDKENGEN